MLHYLKGKKGEDRACEYLETKGYRILERNYISRGGEIDIIARIKDLVVFIEVKCWEVFPAEDLRYAVNGNKQNRIRRSAEYYLLQHEECNDCSLRFDLIFLSRRMGELEHWENAF